MEVLVLVGTVFVLWLLFKKQDEKEKTDATEEQEFYRKEFYTLNELHAHDRIVRSQINGEN